MLLAVTEFITMLPEEKSESKTVRFHIGDATCTGAVQSNASTVNDIIDEVAAAQLANVATPTTRGQKVPWKIVRRLLLELSLPSYSTLTNNEH